MRSIFNLKGVIYISEFINKAGALESLDRLLRVRPGLDAAEFVRTSYEETLSRKINEARRCGAREAEILTVQLRNFPEKYRQPVFSMYARDGFIGMDLEEVIAIRDEFQLKHAGLPGDADHWENDIEDITYDDGMPYHGL